LFCNERLINLDHDFRKLFWGESPKRKVCKATLGRKAIGSQREEKRGDKISWEWTDMEIGKNSIPLWSHVVLCPCYLCYFGGLRFEIVVLQLHCKAQLLEPYLQSLLLSLFCKWCLVNNFAYLILTVIMMSFSLLPRFIRRSYQC
jgi:hypothetical protein